MNLQSDISLLLQFDIDIGESQATKVFFLTLLLVCFESFVRKYIVWEAHLKKRWYEIMNTLSFFLIRKQIAVLKTYNPKDNWP